MTDLFKSLCFNRLPTSLLVSCSEVNKNTLFDCLEHLLDYIVLELFSKCWMNTLIDYLDNLIDYFVEIINYLIDLINYRRL